MGGRNRETIQGDAQQRENTPLKGPWASDVILVRKKDGSLRFAIDYRRLITVTKKDAYNLPNPQTILWISTCVEYILQLLGHCFCLLVYRRACSKRRKSCVLYTARTV